MRRRRIGGGLAVVAGGALLIVSPFFQWLGVRANHAARSFSLLDSLRALRRLDLLGPGMSVIALVLVGAVAVLVGIAVVSTASRIEPLLAIVIGAAAGAYVAYLHAALEYAGFAIAGLNSFRAQTTPGNGLFLAIAGAVAVLGGGMVSATR